MDALRPAKAEQLRWLKTRRGLRLLHGRHTVSEALAQPGPTHSVFDVLGACAALFSSGPRIAILGFAAGGLMAPLRALGSRAQIEGVDLSIEGAHAFRTVAGAWAKPFQVTEGDALRFLQCRALRFDAIIEDLSLQIPGDVTKPPISLSPLPDRIAERLAPEGVAIFNVLPMAGLRMAQVVNRMAQPLDRSGFVVHFQEFDNRILVLGNGLPQANGFDRVLRGALRELGSRQAERIRVRPWPKTRAKNRGSRGESIEFLA